MDPSLLAPAALLLADGRLPSGEHAHSDGVEAAVADGRITDLAGLKRYCRGRLATGGLTAAALAAATVIAVERAVDTTAVRWSLLDDEAGARLVAPAQRDASRRLGRQLLRAARAAWPSPVLEAAAAALPNGPHQSIALGAAAAAAGIDAHAAAVCAVYRSVTTWTTATVRLLGLDPFAVAGLVADLDPAMRSAAAEAAGAAAAAGDAWFRLPAAAGPVVDLAAQRHARWEVRLFGS